MTGELTWNPSIYETTFYITGRKAHANWRFSSGLFSAEGAYAAPEIFPLRGRRLRPCFGFAERPSELFHVYTLALDWNAFSFKQVALKARVRFSD